MFIELDVWNNGKWETRTINTKNIDEFYPNTNTEPPGNNTTVWVYGKAEYPYYIKLSYERFRDLLSMVSLLVNE